MMEGNGRYWKVREGSEYWKVLKVLEGTGRLRVLEGTGGLWKVLEGTEYWRVMGGSGRCWKTRTVLKGSAFLHIISTDGRGVGLCWAHSQPKGPEAQDTGRFWRVLEECRGQMKVLEGSGR